MGCVALCCGLVDFIDDGFCLISDGLYFIDNGLSTMACALLLATTAATALCFMLYVDGRLIIRLGVAC